MMFTHCLHISSFFTNALETSLITMNVHFDA